jgi:hypothetical protein
LFKTETGFSGEALSFDEKDTHLMTLWQQFLLIAGLHFLALLSPGPDFFLIVRSAVVNGTRVASGVCVGIAWSR